jgi:dihydropteroate synthase
LSGTAPGAPDPIAARLGSSPPWITGVLNVTPDSFSDGNRFLGRAAALERAHRMRADGAALIEIGGESTAPGASRLTADQELGRIEALVAELAPAMPIAIDTYHTRTAEHCLELGAVAINDVSALRAEPDLARPVAEHAAVLVLMHAKDAPLPHASDRVVTYRDPVEEIAAFLLSRAELAMGAGVAPERIVLDPGAGRFVSLDPAVTWNLLADFRRLVARLRPFRVMVATSRKSFLGLPLAERDPLSQLTGLAGLMGGADFLRTHEPGMAVQFLDAARKLRWLPPSAEVPGARLG